MIRAGSSAGRPGAGAATPAPGRLRRAILLLAAAGAVGTVAELVLSEHWAEATQWIPFGMAVVVLGCAVALLARADGRPVRAARLAMPVVMASSVYGGVLHALGNRAFEVEVHPAAGAAAQALAAVTGAAPLLAPGILALLATLVWLAAGAPPNAG